MYLKCESSVPLLPENTNVTVALLPMKISAGNASHFYNETMAVTGIVAGVSVRANVALINLDKPYPASPFTAVIFDENFGKFGNPKSYQGKNVKISGDLTEYTDKPEIILESPDQIKAVGSN
jgi:DNA/RNA endonuclease YhcR with UshA esterase domain